MSNKKTVMPDYSDGKCYVYEYTDNDSVYPVKELKDLKVEIWFQELSISDMLRSQLKQNDVKITLKIRIPQYKDIKPDITVLKINDELHKVYNVYHFTNADGIRQSDITLEVFNYD